MSDSQMIRMLDTLSLAAGENKQPVYVSGGKIYFLNEDSLLVSESHPVTQPYIWPIAHDVRPAAQSLGANECQDCHSISSGFYYSTIDVTAPIYPEENKPRQNIDFMDINRAGAWVFSMSFLFRPWLKILIIICLFLQLMILFIYITKAVRALIETMGH
jgi:hypothetical protein